MSDFTEKSKFGWAVMVVLMGIVFGVGGVYFKVDSLDTRLSRIEDSLIERGLNKLSAVVK